MSEQDAPQVTNYWSEERWRFEAALRRNYQEHTPATTVTRWGRLWTWCCERAHCDVTSDAYTPPPPNGWVCPPCQTKEGKANWSGCGPWPSKIGPPGPPGPYYQEPEPLPRGTA